MSSQKKPLHHHLIDYFFPHPRNGYRPHLFSSLSVLVIAIIIVLCEIGYIAQTKFVFINTDFLAAVLPGVLTDLTNQDRLANGLATVVRNPRLDAAAKAVAADMAAKGYFAHVAPDGTTPWYWLDQVGYRFSYAGQNLAVNFTDSEDVESAWLASPTHRGNILKPEYTEVGFGTATGTYQGSPTTFVVEYFAAPAIAVAPRAVSEAPVVALAPATTSASAQAPAVLGSEVKKPVVAVATSSPKASATQPTPMQAEPQQVELAPAAKQFVSVLASPLSTLETVFTILLSIIAATFSIALFMKGKFQHPTVVLGGVFLILFISGALLGTAYMVSPMQFATDPQMSSATAALP